MRVFILLGLLLVLGAQGAPRRHLNPDMNAAVVEYATQAFGTRHGWNVLLLDQAPWNQHESSLANLIGDFAIEHAKMPNDACGAYERASRMTAARLRRRTRLGQPINCSASFASAYLYDANDEPARRLCESIFNGAAPSLIMDPGDMKRLTFLRRLYTARYASMSARQYG